MASRKCLYSNQSYQLKTTIFKENLNHPIMNYKATTYFLLILFSVGVNAYGQNFTSKEVKNKITKSWTVTEIITEGKTHKKETLEILEFNVDGSLLMKRFSEMMGHKSKEVYWSFDKKKQKLILTLKKGSDKKAIEMDIEELSNTKLILSTPRRTTVYIPTEE